MFDYGLPPYTIDDSDYEYCNNESEIVVLRMLKTYVDFVTQRYGVTVLSRQDFSGSPKNNFRYSQYYRGMVELAEQLIDFDVEDPAHFIAFVFEIWKNREHYGKYARLREKNHWSRLHEMAGVAYPSLRYLLHHKQELLDEFKNISDYKPTQFIPADDLESFDRWVVESKVQCWCLAYDKTPEDYWLNPNHLIPPELSAKWIPYADSLWACDEALREKFGFSVRDLKEYLEEYERLMDDPSVPKERIGNIHVLDWEEEDEVVQDRIDLYQQALDNGIDVTSDEFQQEVEDIVNPIDTEHPDTIMWYFYGIGKPRRRDGEEER